VETGHGELLGHRQTKGPATRKATPTPPRHSSTLLRPEETVTFLGYTVGRRHDPRTGWAYIAVRPSDQKVPAICREIHDQTDRRWLWLDPEEMVGRLNRLPVGGSNYFSVGTVTTAYRRVTAHTCHRLRQWLVRKHHVQGSRWTRFSDRSLHDTLGLIRLQRRPPGRSWAPA
jgi:hypothetical protein